MAVTANTNETYDVTTIREDLSEAMASISPTETIFMSTIGSRNVDNTYFECSEVDLAATGFMLLTKSALKRIEPDIETFYLPGDNGQPCEVYNYFDCNVVNKNYLTEDYYFSFLFKKNGGAIYADNSIVLYHIGTHKYGELIMNK